MSSILIYSILTLLLIAIIWFVVGKKIWNSWSGSFWDRAKPKEKSDRYIQTSDLHLRAYSRPGNMIGGRKRSPHDQIAPDFCVPGWWRSNFLKIIKIKFI